MIIYALMTGSYDAYDLHSVYTDKALAEEICAAYTKCDYAEIKEIELDVIPGFLQYTRRGLFPYQVQLLQSGEIYRNLFLAHHEALHNTYTIHEPWSSRPYLVVSIIVWASYAQHAVELAKELHAELVERGEI